MAKVKFYLKFEGKAEREFYEVAEFKKIGHVDEHVSRSFPLEYAEFQASDEYKEFLKRQEEKKEKKKEKKDEK